MKEEEGGEVSCSATSHKIGDDDDDAGVELNCYQQVYCRSKIVIAL